MLVITPHSRIAMKRVLLTLIPTELMAFSFSPTARILSPSGVL